MRLETFVLVEHFSYVVYFKCDKFHWSCAIVDLVGLVPSLHDVFVDPEFFHVGTSWVQHFFSLVFL